MSSRIVVSLRAAIPNSREGQNRTDRKAEEVEFVESHDTGVVVTEWMVTKGSKRV